MPPIPKIPRHVVYPAIVVASFIIASITFAIGGKSAATLYAPGVLHAEHQDANCYSCHSAFRGIRSTGCLSAGCHSRQEIKTSASEPVLVSAHSETIGVPCDSCHVEHLGRKGDLTITLHSSRPPSSWGECGGCHQEDSLKAHENIEEGRCDVCHDSVRAWEDVTMQHDLVAGQECQDCHELRRDKLHRAVGTGCNTCHDTRDWKSVRMKHDQVEAKLRRQCEKCHFNPDRPDEFFHRGLKPQACINCHKSTNTWETGFRHGDVVGDPCTKCHLVPGDRLHYISDPIMCIDCHSDTEWIRSTIRHPKMEALEEHLEEVPCVDCHPASLYQSVPCEDCH